MLDLDKIKTPAAADSKAVQCKYMLSEAARDKLRRASSYTGQNMSAILEIILRDHLTIPGEKA